MSVTSSDKQTGVRPLEVQDMSQLAKHYDVPVALMNLYFCIFNNRIYTMEPFLILMAQRKGIQRIALTKPEQKDGDWLTECKIYPAIPDKVLATLPSLSSDQQAALLDYYMQPTVEWGRASPATVKMSSMQPYLREMSIKRAVTRYCRKFAGIDFTSFEELPEAHLSHEQLVEARKTIVVDAKQEDAMASIPSIENKDSEQEQVRPERPSETSNPMPELCKCGHTKHLHATGLKGEVVCIIGTKEGKQCLCESSNTS